MSPIYGAPGNLALEQSNDVRPTVILTVTGLGVSTVTVRITRSVGGESLTVPGALAWEVVDSGALTDYAPPLNIQATYTLYVDGVIADVKTVTAVSEHSWIQDPRQPDRCLPVVLGGIEPGCLTLGGESLQAFDYPAGSSTMPVMGDSYPVAFGGQRSAARGVNLTLHAMDAPGRDMFALIKESPVLLFRPAVAEIPLPPMTYMLAAVTATHHGAGSGEAFTTWSVSGDLVRAVLQQVISGFLTYDDVQAVLGVYTYDEVQALAAGTTYLDWQKNPLIFTTL